MPANDRVRTAQTILRMQRAIDAGRNDPVVAAAAHEAVGHLGTAAPLDRRLNAVFTWIQDRIRFQDDPPSDELLLEPGLLLRLPPAQRAGDCDDFAMLGSAMLGSLGIPTRLVTIRADRSDPTRYSHVYLDIPLAGGGRIPFDASHGPHAGWEAPVHFGGRVWSSSMIGHTSIGLGQFFDPFASMALASQPTAGAGSQVLQSLLRIGEGFATSFQHRLANPPGTYITGPGGTYYRGPENQPAFPPFLPTLSIGGGAQILPWVLAGVGVIVLVSAIGGRKGRSN
jgi:hypothetical protein